MGIMTKNSKSRKKRGGWGIPRKKQEKHDDGHIREKDGYKWCIHAEKYIEPNGKDWRTQCSLTKDQVDVRNFATKMCHYNNRCGYETCNKGQMKISVGTKIQVIAGFGESNPGKVIKANADGTYNIQFDDGGIRNNTPLTEMNMERIWGDVPLLTYKV